ncbi:hypothetical protein MAR_010473 [Mya arenaria]|uniref:Uncharacterized protein n=1 Tax=Mya arenaria TaxID=6604 RepID=A0ABY7E265_MYAAR|nr:hypothetical protein MAR_010473 [Mya arenaria]
MVKSRAEIQRKYRQRLKEKNNSDCLRRERDRKIRSYVPSSSLSENDREERNRRNRQNLRRYYQKKRAERARNSTQETNGYESDKHETTNERGRMLVRMDFSNRDSGKRKGALKRWKRDKSLATSRVRMLEQERDKLFRKYRSTQHSLQRLKVRLNTGQANAEMTPNKETEMKDAKLDKFQREKLKKSLLFGHVLAKEIKETKKATSMSKLKALHRVVSGKIVKKYKIIKHLSDKTGLCRHPLSRSITKNHQIRTSRRLETGELTHKSYITVSSEMAHKASTVTIILCDTPVEEALFTQCFKRIGASILREMQKTLIKQSYPEIYVWETFRVNRFLEQPRQGEVRNIFAKFTLFKDSKA